MSFPRLNFYRKKQTIQSTKHCLLKQNTKGQVQ
uniref:Uncharacterized protein n=1 Tax=Rhizophora mucronata TaxID=61149 RepID=A0A2P2M147_RHIMU